MDRRDDEVQRVWQEVEEVAPRPELLLWEGERTGSLRPRQGRRRMSAIHSERPDPLAGVCLRMIERRYVFPGVIEMNYQARRRMGVNIYLIDGGSEYALIDVGFLDELPRRARADPADGFQPLRVQDDHRDPRRRRPHPGPHPGPRGPQVRGRRPPQERRARSKRRRGPHLRPDRRPGNPHPDAALQGRPGDRRGRSAARSATRRWRSGARPATPPASSRSGWATCSSPATTSSATAASA